MEENLKLEEGLELTLERGNDSIKTVLRGWKQGHFIIVDFPKEGGWTTPTADPVIGRLMGRGAYYGFMSQVLGVMREFKLLALAFPEDVIETPLRKAERYNVHLPMTITQHHGQQEKTATGILVNMSEGGAKFASSKYMDKGARLLLSIDFPTGEKIEKLRCTLRMAEHNQDSHMYGVEFHTIEDSDLEPIKKFIEQLGTFALADQSGQSGDAEKIPIGEFCQVQVGMSKLRSTFRGFEFPKHLLMDVPKTGNKYEIVPHNTVVTVRYLNKGHAFKFDATVRKAYTKPVPLLLCEYPYPIKSLNLRKSSRIETLLPTTLQTTEDTISGAIVDLSEGGGCFSTNTNVNGSLEVGVSYFLTAKLPTGEMVEKLLSRICNVKKKNGKTIVGFSFQNTDDEPYTMLKSYYQACSLSELK